MFEVIRDSVLSFFEGVLTSIHQLFEPLFGAHSWGWAIIALTLVVRIALLPLAIKQTRSMRAMQALQPQMKELQKKYKADRELLKKDPQQYKAKKQKLNEEMMALYQREGANPAASCLPLLAQAPIFLGLFWTLQQLEDLAGAPFYFFTSFISDDAGVRGLAANVSEAGWPGWLLIMLMSGTMFLAQKQMMARSAAQGGDNPMAQQQKMLLYIMPVFLAVVSFNFPLGILLYWVTTNIWQVGQQWIILREVRHEAAEGTLASKPGGEGAKNPLQRRSKRGRTNDEVAADDPEQGQRRRSPGASSGKRPLNGERDGDDATARGPSTAGDGTGAKRGRSRPEPKASDGSSQSRSNGAAGGRATAGKRDHLPRRRGGSNS